ncbi:MAG: Beta-lactamase domain protein [Candidatus Gottesmanbacteria bacterium GW2011_GWA1_43_11]|uniref:Ribonuclease J n=1 Tax=Candidatus Gottesmanbacteria bacterium GW2011_GWA1_43_11 TaxID=1618436 RepID=A0A0G1CFZ3_9BACT|nr:MAG: Beta-lactamase domain protein [Candidatus Gottesmanbacteria bacterium GW2011_GWA1_43_11]
MSHKIFVHDKQTVRIFPLGGIGNVTKNMYVYEYRLDGQLVDILLVDCGIGFPDETMYGVDLVIPDASYLLNKKDKIRAFILTHGHDDHIGALPYVLPKLPSFPIYATKLTAGFAEAKIREFGIGSKISVLPFTGTLTIGPFKITPVHVTHSIPDAANFVIETPIGIFYHGSDFKFDLTPPDNFPSELGKIAAAGEKGVLCLLSDSLGSERSGYTLSERIIEETIESEVRKCGGKLLFATQSSNISRIQQAVNVALQHNRKIAFVGRSMDQNSEVARRLGYLSIPESAIVHDKQILRLPDNLLFIIVAGSQGQTDSALARIARGEHKFVKLRDADTVILSADPIPGNENAVHELVDALTQGGARVSYSEVMEDLHVSGHGSQQDLRLMLSLTKPKFMLPIGGTYRHMVAYQKLAVEMGHDRSSVLIPGEGEVLEFSATHRPRVVERIETEQIMLDGLGVGDVGAIVLRDRRTLASEGIVVIMVPVEKSINRVRGEPDIVSRGFVYMKDSGAIVAEMKQIVNRHLRLKKGKIFDWHFIRRNIEEEVSRFLFKETGRKPLIVPVVIEV